MPEPAEIKFVENDSFTADDLEAMKIGRRNSSKDAERLQGIHDYAVENGALCGQPAKSAEQCAGWPAGFDPEESLVMLGSEVKALGDGRVGGYLVRFSTEQDPDISGARDFFDAATDFMIDFPAKSATWFNHALDAKKKRLSHDADLRRDEFGVWAETILDERDRYEKFLLELAGAGKLGWSSGTAAHLVDREPVGAAHHVKCWPLGLDASLTHIPAEPRNEVTPLKSISALLPPLPPEDLEPEGVTAPDEAEAEGGETEVKSNLEVFTMDITEEKLQEMISQAADRGAEKALKSLPAEEVKAGVQVTHDPADNPFVSLAEQCAAVKAFEVSRGGHTDDRLRRLAIKGGTGASENVPSEGGYLLEPTLVAEVLKPMHESGPFTRFVRRLPVGANSNYGWINGVDETSRATGSRWGGIRGYRVGEGATITASKPKFRRINWELKKYAVLVYGTDELLADASQFSEVVRVGAAEELAFMANDDILNGIGASGALGILTTSAYVEVSGETNQTAATIVSENLSKMWARLDSRAKGNAVWFINTDCNPQLDLLSINAGTAALEPRFVNYGNDGIMRIKGRPVIESEFNATLGTVGDILLADMSQYLWWEKGGVQAASSIHLQFLTDEEVFRFVYRCDGAPSISSPLTPYKGSNTVSPFVVLATRS
jgi:HK97 family phage major capsid protein